MQFSIYLLLLLLLLLLLPVESFHDDFVGIGCIFDFTVRQPVSIGCHCLAVIVERSIAVLVALSGNNYSSSKWLSKGYVIMLKWSDLLSATVSGFRCRELIYLWCVIWRNISTTIECPAFKKIFFFFFFLLFNFSLSRARSLSLYYYRFFLLLLFFLSPFSWEENNNCSSNSSSSSSGGGGGRGSNNRNNNKKCVWSRKKNGRKREENDDKE